MLTVSNIGGTSKTVINNSSITSTEAGAGSTNITGGFLTVNGTYTGTVTGLTSSNAAAYVDGGAIVNNGLAVTGGQTVSGGSTIYGGQTVHGSQTVTGQSYLNGGATISNNLTVSGPGNGGSPTTIDMGGNRVQDVGTPIFGTDAANKAYVDRGLNKAYEGTAIALAISQPVLATGQSFAIRAGWGDYESQNAFGVSAVGVVGRDWFWGGSTVAIDGGIGFGNSNSVAGKVGVTLGFGPGLAAYGPLK